MVEYRDPYSAFGGGLESGLRMGLLGLQMKQQKANDEQMKRQQAYEQDYKKFKTTTDFLESKIGKNLPDATKTGLYNKQVISFFNKYSPEVPLQEIGSWKELTPDFMTKLKSIDEASDDRGFKINALFDLMAEADSAREEAAIKGKIDILQGEEESSMLSQASRLTNLQTEDPRQFAAIQQVSQQYPDVVSPVSQYRREALAGGGAKGQELLAAGMETEEDKTNYKERDLPLKGDMEQRQYSQDGGKTWQNLGTPSKKGGVRDTYADEQVRNRMVTNFNADPNVRRFGQMENFANIINDASIGDNPIAHASIPTLMARAVGEVGALTEADKKPFGGSSALIPRLEQVLTQLASGKRTPDNIKFLQDLTDTLIKGSQKNKAKIARERAKQYAAAYRGKFSEDDIFNMLSPESIETPNLPSAVPMGTPKRRTTDKNSDPLGLR